VAVAEGQGRAVVRSVADATHELYRAHGREIYAYCLRRLRSREEAEDATQTTFMNVFRALQRGTVPQYEQAWLFRIAQNVCLTRQSSATRRLRVEAPSDLEVLEEVVPARSSGEALELFGLEEALERMPENQRRAILLREWQGLSYREIARTLQLSQVAVEMLIFRARRSLAAALEQPGERRVRSRRVGSGLGLAPLLGTFKSLLGGGTAVKAATVAIAALTVVTTEASGILQRRPARVHALAGLAVSTVATRPAVAARQAVAPPPTRRPRPAPGAPATRLATRRLPARPRPAPAAAPPELATTKPAATPTPPAAPAPQPVSEVAPAAAAPPPPAAPAPTSAPAPLSPAGDPQPTGPSRSAASGKSGHDRGRHEGEERGRGSGRGQRVTLLAADTSGPPPQPPVPQPPEATAPAPASAPPAGADDAPPPPTVDPAADPAAAPPPQAQADGADAGRGWGRGGRPGHGDR
jgi:RNA polymerase sigma-70 factor (ECF subfamily)